MPMVEVDTQAAKLLVNRILAEQPAGRELTEIETAELLHLRDRPGAAVRRLQLGRGSRGC